MFDRYLNQFENKFPNKMKYFRKNCNNIHHITRKVLRDIWFHSHPRMLSFFALGKVHSKSLQKKIEEENNQYKDILQGMIASNNIFITKSIRFFTDLASFIIQNICQKVHLSTLTII